MAHIFTPQELAAAAVKRAASRAANRAAGTSVRQQRAAKHATKAAAAGQPYTPPATPNVNPSTNPFRRSRRRRRGFSTTPPPTQAPVFATPRPNYRALKLSALVALETVFTQKLTEHGITDEIRSAYGTYRKLKTLALGTASGVAAATEADAALRMATVHLVKLAF